MDILRIQYHQNVLFNIIMNMYKHERTTLNRLLNFMLSVNSKGFWLGLKGSQIYLVSLNCSKILNETPDDLIGRNIYSVISNFETGRIEFNLECVLSGNPQLTRCAFLDAHLQEIDMVWLLVPTMNHHVISYAAPALDIGKMANWDKDHKGFV